MSTLITPAKAKGTNITRNLITHIAEDLPNNVVRHL
jgi:hypothetical protein